MQILGWLMFLIFALLLAYGIVASIVRWTKAMREEAHREWRRVPPPEWAAKRGGRDYW